MKILVVEDDVSLGDSVRALLENWGHETQHCTRGKDAVRIFMTNPYDLVLMEVILPDIKGEELISRLKDLSPETNIITMTGNNSPEMEVRIRGQGILYYMVKPVETENLRCLLEHLAKRTRSYPCGSGFPTVPLSRDGKMPLTPYPGTNLAPQ